MSITNPFREQFSLAFYIFRWGVIAAPLGMMVGSACALFLWSLDRATQLRFEYPWLLFLLPLAGLAIGWLYTSHGKSVEAGNNLIVDEIHEPGGGVPLRMAPLVLFSTVVTHLFGGSAGREGTAVQMGGSLASGLSRLIPGLGRHDVRKLLMAGIAGGFGGVFGTPVAGTIFAMEVLAMGRMGYAAFLPCLMTSVVSDQTCIWWGIGHTHYRVASLLPATSTLYAPPLDARLLAIVVLAGAVFGLTSLLFSELVHGLHAVFKRICPGPIVRPVLGGLIVIGLVWVTGTRDYLGLGVTSPEPGAVTIVSSFQAGGANTWSWLWKLIFTTVTLASGFKGGEVTPLFFIGAALGNTLSTVFAVPADLFAALGFVSVFAGATNTPIACTVMAVELFGGEFTLYYMTSCLMAYLFSGHSGIYLSQRIATPKGGRDFVTPEVSLRETRAARVSRSKSAPPT